MAWYTGTYACGHEGRTNIIGPQKNREWIREQRFSELCPECKQKKFLEDCEKRNKLSKEKAEDMELPALEGSPKQIAWAETLRIQLIDDAEKQVDLAKGTENEEFFCFCYNEILHETRARFFIDRRGDEAEYVFRFFRKKFEEMKKDNSLDGLEEKNVDAENTVTPENGNDIPVKISEIDGNMVAKCEKNEDARRIFKSLKMVWNGNRWERKMTETTGSFEDRAAELGNKLLASGFSVVCYDENAREKAVSGNYEEEKKYFLMSFDGEKDIFIKLKENNERLYNGARRIPSAKWDRKLSAIRISPNHYEEVLAFCDDVGICILPGAEKIIESYQKEKKKEQIVSVDKHVYKEDKLDEILNSSNEILDDLKED